MIVGKENIKLRKKLYKNKIKILNIEKSKNNEFIRLFNLDNENIDREINKFENLINIL